MNTVKTYLLKINGIEITVIKKKLKHLNLAVLPPDGKVRISVPNRIKEETIRNYAISKIPWIRKQQQKFISQTRLPKSEYVTGETHYFLGKRYLLNVVSSSEKPKAVIRKKKYIDLYVPPTSERNFKEKILVSWYRRELQRTLPEIVAKWEQRMGVKSSSVSVRKMKTRWGTCNIKSKKILLNLELIKKSPECLEYVVVHELVHLLEKYHNDNFKALMSKFMPKWVTYKEELNKSVIKHEEWSY